MSAAEALARISTTLITPTPASTMHLASRLQPGHAGPEASARRSVLARSAVEAMPYQVRPGSRVVTSWTSHALPSGSLKEKNDP
jgi:hypothetical protein